MSDGVKRTTIADELAKGKSVTYFTVGISMRPLLRERETHVTIAPLTDEPRIGDILLYLRPGNVYVLHRLVGREGNILLIRGDNTYALERVDPAQVIGVVTHIYRRGKLFDVRARRSYRLYVSFWNFIYPLRYFVKRVGWRIRGKLKRRKT